MFSNNFKFWSFLNFFLFINSYGFAVDSEKTKLENRRICYSSLDKRRIVRCSTACVFKTIINEKEENQKRYRVRLGCEADLSESRSYGDYWYNCVEHKNKSIQITKDYSIQTGDNALFVRKVCCWKNLCNEPHINRHHIKLFESSSTVKTTSIRLSSNSFMTSLIIFLLSLLALAVPIKDIMKHETMLNTKKIDNYNCKINSSILSKSNLNWNSVVDTKIYASGHLKLHEISEKLALLPELSKDRQTSSNSLSAEESSGMPRTKSRETKLLNNIDLMVRVRPPLLVKAKGTGHKLYSTKRITNSPFDLLYRLMEHGPYKYPFTALELLQLFEETSYRFSEEPSLLEIDAGITIIGDIRGSYNDLHRWLHLTGWPPRNRILFLGGIIDNDEEGSIECLTLICALKCRFPKHVYVLRGIPETEPFQMSNRFHPKICLAIQSCITRMCSNIPFAAIVGNKILVVYSGFSPMINEKSHLLNLFRPALNDSLTAVEQDLIYNQPSDNVQMYRPNYVGKGSWFGKLAVERACEAMGTSTMIRGRSVIDKGYLPCWERRLINIWSAPGSRANYGAILNVSKDLRITPILMYRQAFFEESLPPSKSFKNDEKMNSKMNSK